MLKLVSLSLPFTLNFYSPAPADLPLNHLPQPKLTFFSPAPSDLLTNHPSHLTVNLSILLHLLTFSQIAPLLLLLTYILSCTCNWAKYLKGSYLISYKIFNCWSIWLNLLPLITKCRLHYEFVFFLFCLLKKLKS